MENFEFSIYVEESDHDDEGNSAKHCCIYRVPENLRKTNKSAYRPQSILMGPFNPQYQRRNEYSSMEEQKVRYIEKFRQRKQVTAEKWKNLRILIQEEETIILSCYEESSKLQSTKFVIIVQTDAVFIIEFFLRNYKNKLDIYLTKPHLKYQKSLDLLLLENQLPFFILEKLYNAFNFESQGYPSFTNLSFLFFCGSQRGRINTRQNVKINHFTDLRRIALLEGFNKELNKSDGSVVDLPCAVKLHKSGVKFKCPKKDSPTLEIKFAKGKRKLRIPRLKEDEGTECLIRNIMTLELCHYESRPLVCNYIDFMDFLINIEEDVDLLVEKGIISNHLGDNASVAFMFNRLCRHVHVKNSCYYNISQDLITHYKSSWNHSPSNVEKCVLQRSLENHRNFGCCCTPVAHFSAGYMFSQASLVICGINWYFLMVFLSKMGDSKPSQLSWFKT